MEFLMTYGWALVVVLVAIGALAFFGVLNPSQFLPETCVLGPGFACDDFKVVNSDTDDDDDRIFINVQNGIGKSLDLFMIYVGKETPETMGNEMCGGLTGFIAISDQPGNGLPSSQSMNALLGSISAPTNPKYDVFLDGEVRDVISLTGENTGVAEIDLNSGINCNPNVPPAENNCCDWQYNSIFRGISSDYFCPAGAVGEGVGYYDCTDGSGILFQPLGNPGTKFSEDIVIVYQTVDSQIMHSRVGKLSAQIEAP